MALLREQFGGEQAADLLHDVRFRILRIGYERSAARHHRRAHIRQALQSVVEFGAIQITESMMWQ